MLQLLAIIHGGHISEQLLIDSFVFSFFLFSSSSLKLLFFVVDDVCSIDASAASGRKICLTYTNMVVMIMFGGFCFSSFAMTAGLERAKPKYELNRSVFQNFCAL
jgi:hypothetical protein